MTDAQALNRWGDKVTVIRPSSLSMYADCPRRGAARLFWREVAAAGFQLRQTVRGIGAIVGTAVHAAAEIVYTEKAKNGAAPPEHAAIDLTITSLEKGIATAPVEYDNATHNRADALAQAVRMTRSYFRTIVPQVEPILVEERLEAEVAPGVVLSGQPDIVAREPNGVRDLKTGQRLGSHAPQIGAYALLARSHGVEIDEAAIDWLPRVKPDKPQPSPITHKVRLTQAETAASSIIKHMAEDLRTFREGDPARRILPGDEWSFLANPSSVLCSRRWCPAHSTNFCAEGRE
jgi:PD-(D/E)XK nuclease superfamily